MNKSLFLNFIKQNKKLIISLFIIIIIIILTLYFYYRETFISEGFFQENTLPTTTTTTTMIINPPEDKRTYSSFYNSNPGYKNSALDSSLAWSSQHLDTSQWMTIDLDNIRNVAGIITQGRANRNQRVTSYKVSVSKDNINYFYVTTSETSGIETDPVRGHIFIGNTDANTKVEHRFNFPLQARYVRYHAVTFINRISMRAGVIVSTTTTTTTTQNPTTTMMATTATQEPTTTMMTTTATQNPTSTMMATTATQNPTSTIMATTATQNPTTTQSSSSNSPILKMNNQKIIQTENKVIIENNKYEVNFKNNKLQICNKNTYNCNIIYEYTGNSKNIVLLINKEGYLNITNKDTNNLLWTTQTSNIDNNKNNFFNISNDNKFSLLINDIGDLQIIDTTNNSIKWSALKTQDIYQTSTTSYMTSEYKYTKQNKIKNIKYLYPNILSTNIYQKNFSGTSNVFSPYLYYNKNKDNNLI